ncbi:hypothetical protein VTO42DRAFT_3147 [Malbranchea cinnamomea]
MVRERPSGERFRADPADGGRVWREFLPREEPKQEAQEQKEKKSQKNERWERRASSTKKYPLRPARGPAYLDMLTAPTFRGIVLVSILQHAIAMLPGRYGGDKLWGTAGLGLETRLEKGAKDVSPPTLARLFLACVWAKGSSGRRVLPPWSALRVSSANRGGRTDGWSAIIGAVFLQQAIPPQDLPGRILGPHPR